MSQKIITALEEISRLARTNAGMQKAREAIETARAEAGAGPGSFKELDKELSVWLLKLSVIWKEPAGRQGLAKHAHFWAERLRNICHQN